MWNEAFYITGTSILNDEIFIQYGGLTGSTTAMQRNIAYMIAEQEAMHYLNTFLVPTTVTGSWRWDNYYQSIGNIIQLPVNLIRNITGVVSLHDNGCTCDPIEIDGCGVIVDSAAGIVDISSCSNGGILSCSCGHNITPDRFKIGFTAGFDDGVILNNSMALMGLVTAADLALTQLTDCSADGDPQITSFSDSGYSESRAGLKMTVFGGSPKANLAARMLDGLKYKRILRF